MNQPRVLIRDEHKSYGIKKVHQINWNARGQLVYIKVDFLGNESELLTMNKVRLTNNTFESVNKTYTAFLF